MFESVKDEIHTAFDGHYVSLIAYGATGTGKTHSCNTIMERSIREIDLAYGRCRESGEHMEISAQLLEVYNEQVRDLLGGTGAGPGNASARGNNRRAGRF